MESLFQNSVTEFDLNFLDQTTNVNQATRSVQCPISRKQGIARIKDRLKGVSQVVHKAKHTNQLLLEIQQELLGAKQELDETRNLLFEKNEESKVICDERNTYFNQATEYSAEIQKLKENLKQLKDTDYESKLKDKIISGYIDQLTALQTEMTILTGDKKHSVKETSNALLQANKEKGVMERKLVKLLKDYVYPTIKKQDKWLLSLMKKYLPDKVSDSNNLESQQTGENVFEDVPMSPIYKEEESQKVQQSSENMNTDCQKPVLDGVRSPTHNNNNSLLHRTNGLEFECVGSVDTGRGSSLAFSDGDKSFHSPDYYINDSPPCIVPSLCSKCNTLRSDVSTSPIPQETSDILTNSFLSKRDVCTSPIPLEQLDVATDTADILYEKDTAEKHSGVIANLERQTNILDVNPLHISETSLDLTRTDDLASAVNNAEIANYHDKSNQEWPRISAKLEQIASNTGEIVNENVADTDGFYETSRMSSPADDLTSDFDEDLTTSNNIVVNVLPSTPMELDNTIPDKNNCSNANKVPEKECLELNNSENFSSDAGTDREIQMILDKMRLQHELITPIPKTPQITRRSESSIADNQNEVLASGIREKNLLAGSFSKELSLIRARILAAITPIVETLPIHIQELPQLLTDGRQDEEFVRNLLSHPNSSENMHTSEENRRELLSRNRHVQSNTKNELQSVNLNNDIAPITKPKDKTNIGNKNNCFTSHDNAETQLSSKSDVIEQTINNNVHKVCQLRQKLSNTVAVAEDFNIATLNNETGNSKHYNVNGGIPNENTRESITNSNINSSSNVETNIPYLDTSQMQSDINSRHNIVYESEGNDVEMEQNADLDERPNSYEMTQIQCKRIQKMRKLTKLEKMRLKMVPKSKIRNAFKQTVKQRRYKPTPVIIPQSITKKKVTEKDSAASLNEKSVYENAVKVIAASKLKLTPTKEPRIIVEDCVAKLLKASPQKGSNESFAEGIIINKPHLLFDTLIIANDNKRKLQNISDVPRKLTKDSNESVVYNERKSRNRIHSINVDNDFSDNELTLKEIQDMLIDKSAKHTSDDKLKCNQSIHNTEIKPAKRKRTSISDSGNSNENSSNKFVESIDTQTNNVKNTACETITAKRHSVDTGTKPKQAILENSTDAVVASQRILRSSNVRLNKENELEKTHVALGSTCLPATIPVVNTDKSLKKIHFKADQLQVEQDNIGRRLRSDSQSIATRRRSENNHIESLKLTLAENIKEADHDRIVTYTDLSMFSNDVCDQKQTEKMQNNKHGHKENVLCHMIEKYGKHRMKLNTKKLPDSKVDELCNKLESSLTHIIELPHDQSLAAMKKLVVDIQNCNVKLFLVAFLKYLKNPQRKIELFKKLSCPPAPPMTSREQVLLYVIDELQNSKAYSGIVKKILANIEYVLFALNKPAEHFDVIETISHFYALLCRSYQKLSKLRLFIVDAMYCLQYKSIVLVKQCLDVWMFVLPLGHMGLAKTPLVSCLVYLLHFYKCDDKFDRVKEIRNILRRKYNYDLSDWNETKILELFRTAIIELRDAPNEKKMLRLALIILAKRNGPTWCQNNIIKKMLQPLSKDKNTSEVAKQFCVSLLGPLLKPYPNNMKVHCEMITDHLLDMLGEKNSPKMQEAIVSSLLCTNFNKENNRLINFLLKWNPKRVSPQFESVFRDYVRSKPLKKWKAIISSSHTFVGS